MFHKENVNKLLIIIIYYISNPYGKNNMKTQTLLTFTKPYLWKLTVCIFEKLEWK